VPAGTAAGSARGGSCASSAERRSR
jgi:hypothetical protein